MGNFVIGFLPGLLAGLLAGMFATGILIGSSQDTELEAALEAKGYSEVSLLDFNRDKCELSGGREIVYTEEGIRKNAIACMQVILK